MPSCCRLLLAALGTLWCVVDLGRRLWTRRVGLYAGWALLFALQFTYQAKKAQIDPLVTFWITLANYGLLRFHLDRGEGQGAVALLGARLVLRPGWARSPGRGRARAGDAVAGVVRGLARLAADPQAALDPRLLLGPLAFAAAAALWLAPMLSVALSRHDPAFAAYVQDILFHQTAGRYAKSWDHPHSPLYYLGVMPSMWIPLLLALPWACPRGALPRAPLSAIRRYLLPLAWWVLVVLFFSDPARQARCSHHAGAADGMPGAGAAVAGHRAQGVAAPDRVDVRLRSSPPASRAWRCNWQSVVRGRASPSSASNQRVGGGLAAAGDGRLGIAGMLWFRTGRLPAIPACWLACGCCTASPAIRC